MTILRFTHAFRKGGGVEQYLEDLNKALLFRNKTTIIQLYLPEEGRDEETTVEEVGKGKLIQVPMIPRNIRNPVETEREVKYQNLRELLRGFVRDWVLYNPVVRPAFRELILRTNFRLYDREPIDAGEKVRHLLQKHSISLIVIHLGGGFGSAEVIREAQARGIPYGIFNHFTNDWFSRTGMREQAKGAEGVAGVSSLRVPRHVRSKYTNLLDGVDVDFFSETNVNIERSEKWGPVVLLPSRITEGKGHLDLVKVAASLKKKGLDFQLAFAGREDSLSFRNRLACAIKESDLQQRVIFTGHLDAASLRKWYAKADVVVLPSYSEGLGRVLIESQAMGRPVVAYRVGGVPDAMVNEKTGYLVSKGDLGGLEMSLERLLLEPRKRAVMGRAGQEFTRRSFSISALAQRHESWYLDMIACRKRRSQMENAGLS